MVAKVDIQFLIETARRAGSEIMDVYRTDFSVSYKEHDQSPLTQADLRSNTVILSALKTRYPEIPVLSEEDMQIPFEVRKSWKYFWLVDPLDGTKEFVNKRGDFTVNIALIEYGSPALGVVYAPESNVLYYAVKNHGAFKVGNGNLPQKLPVPQSAKTKTMIVASRSHMSPETREYIQEKFPDEFSYEIVSVGSSLKICLVAEGTADIYPRLGPTMEWDTAAAHAVVIESGKRLDIVDEDGRDTNRPVVYNKENLLNPWFVVK